MKKPILYNGLSSYMAYRFYEGIDARFDSRPFTPSDEVCITRSLNVAFEDARDSWYKQKLEECKKTADRIVEIEIKRKVEAVREKERLTVGDIYYAINSAFPLNKLPNISPETMQAFGKAILQAIKDKEKGE